MLVTYLDMTVVVTLLLNCGLVAAASLFTINIRI